MTRKVAYRAWHKQLKDMFTVTHLHFGIDGIVKVETGSNSWGAGDVELMEFTGLRDSHGEDIYESDIVIWDGGQYTVTFSEVEGAWILKDDRDDWECPSLYGVRSPAQSRIAILSNIYEYKED